MSAPERYAVLSVEEARERVLAGLVPLGSEPVALADALGRVLAEDIHALENIPPLANSAMDGYALRADDTSAASREKPAVLRVVASLAAGGVYKGLIGPGEAVRIMTGAPIPAGSDCVVPFEYVSEEAGNVRVTAPLTVGRNVRQAGEDVRCGQLVLSKGTRIRAQEIGLLAGLGKTTVQVSLRPLVALLATGDELAADGAALAPGLIRNINGPANAAQVRLAGGIPLELGIARDAAGELTAKIRRGLEGGARLFITSGGVSAGDFDLVKDVLKANGSLDFWWVNMKPGRPLAFGRLGGVPLLALPGNPVAAFISFELFGRPAIEKLLGMPWRDLPTVYARLQEPVKRKDGRRHYLRVRLSKSDNSYLASLTGDQGSGIMTSLVQADGLAIIPETCDHLEAGSLVEVILLS